MRRRACGDCCCRLSVRIRRAETVDGQSREAVETAAANTVEVNEVAADEPAPTTSTMPPGSIASARVVSPESLPPLADKALGEWTLDLGLSYDVRISVQPTQICAALATSGSSYYGCNPLDTAPFWVFEQTLSDPDGQGDPTVLLLITAPTVDVIALQREGGSELCRADVLPDPEFAVLAPQVCRSNALATARWITLDVDGEHLVLPATAIGLGNED